MARTMSRKWLSCVGLTTYALAPNAYARSISWFCPEQLFRGKVEEGNAMGLVDHYNRVRRVRHKLVERLSRPCW
jgi:hypothetical protein